MDHKKWVQQLLGDTERTNIRIIGSVQNYWERRVSTEMECKSCLYFVYKTVKISLKKIDLAKKAKEKVYTSYRRKLSRYVKECNIPIRDEYR